jgi:hypothetical protein
MPESPSGQRAQPDEGRNVAYPAFRLSSFVCKEPNDVEASAERVAVDSPVPVVVDLPGQPPRRLPAGRHVIVFGEAG